MDRIVSDLLNRVRDKRYSRLFVSLFVIEVIIGLVIVPGHQGAFIVFFLLNAIIGLYVGAICCKQYFFAKNDSLNAGAKGLFKQVLKCMVLAALIEFCTLFGSHSANLPFQFDFSLKRFACIAFVVFSIQTVCGYYSELIYNGRNRLINHFRIIQWKQLLAVIAAALLISLVASAMAGYANLSQRSVFMFSFCGLSCVGCLIVLVRGKAPLEFIFSVVSLFAGLALILSFPASNLFSWDDETHYKKALSISYISNVETTASDRALFNVLTVEPGFQYSASFDRFPLSETSTWSQEAISQFERELNINATADTVEIEPGVSSSVTTVVSAGYIPSAIGLWFGRLLHLPFVWTFALGRMVNLLFYIAIIAISIAIIPCKKALICAVALLPTSLFLAANYSYDPWVMSLTILGFSLFVKSLTVDSTDSLKLAICAILVMTIGFFAKAIYFPILAICFLGMRRCRGFSGVKGKPFLCAFALCCAFLIISFLLPMVIAVPGSDGDMRGGPDVSSSRQIGFIMSHPLVYLKTLVRFLITSYLPLANQDNAMTNLAYLGYLDELYPFVTGLMSIYLIGVALLDSGAAVGLRVGVSYKLLIGIIIAVTLGLIASALYVSFTPVAHPTIEGVQARYMLPLYPLALGLLCNCQHHGLNENKFGYSVAFVSGAITFSVFWILLGSRIVS